MLIIYGRYYQFIYYTFNVKTRKCNLIELPIIMLSSILCNILLYNIKHDTYRFNYDLMQKYW